MGESVARHDTTPTGIYSTNLLEMLLGTLGIKLLLSCFLFNKEGARRGLNSLETLGIELCVLCGQAEESHDYEFFQLQLLKICLVQYDE